MTQGATSTAHAAAMPDGYIARLPEPLRNEANALRQIHDLFWRGWHCPNQDCNVCAPEPRPAEPLIASVPLIVTPDTYRVGPIDQDAARLAELHRPPQR